MSGWSLAVALDCQRIDDPPFRLSLDRADEVEIGRGTDRGFHRAAGKLRIDLPDRWASQVHLHLTRLDGGWVLEDAGSKNGSRVNGRRATRATLGDGDVVECGGTFLIMRCAEGPVRDLPRPAGHGVRTIAPALEQELAVLPKLARSRVPVVVRGDSGTGKEVVASAIHALSGRTGPLVAVNCGAIPDTLIENELFGSRRGAFSGAEDRPGLVRSAEGGTLFLDEFADLPPPSQAALLRMLQESQVTPVGSERPVDVDLRVVSATHRQLGRMVREGTFRHDLLARLDGVRLQLPPLRERREDVPLLIAALLDKLAPAQPDVKLLPDAAQALLDHHWPLNVRELEHALEGALALARGRAIGRADLPRLVVEPTAEPPPALSATDERQRAEMITLLGQHRGNLAAVARAMGKHRNQILRWMERYALDANKFRA